MKPQQRPSAAEEQLNYAERFPEVEPHSSKGYFGVPLDHEAPIVVCDCLAILRFKGLEEEGLFRVPGNSNKVNALKEMYNREFATVEQKLNNKTSVLNAKSTLPGNADVASLLKSFLAELSEPLIPKPFALQMIQIVSSDGPKERKVKDVSRVLRSMPKANKGCLSLIISFLREVCNFESANQMGPTNLATCFVLCMMQGSDGVDQLLYMGPGAQVIVFLISNAVTLRMPSMDNVKANTRFDPNRENDPVAESKENLLDDDNLAAAKSLFAKKQSGTGGELLKSRKRFASSPLSTRKVKAVPTLKAMDKITKSLKNARAEAEASSKNLSFNGDPSDSSSSKKKLSKAEKKLQKQREQEEKALEKQREKAEKIARKHREAVEKQQKEVLIKNAKNSPKQGTWLARRVIPNKLGGRRTKNAKIGNLNPVLKSTKKISADAEIDFQKLAMNNSDSLSGSLFATAETLASQAAAKVREGNSSFPLEQDRRTSELSNEQKALKKIIDDKRLVVRSPPQHNEANSSGNAVPEKLNAEDMKPRKTAPGSNYDNSVDTLERLGEVASPARSYGSRVSEISDMVDETQPPPIPVLAPHPQLPNKNAAGKQFIKKKWSFLTEENKSPQAKLSKKKSAVSEFEEDEIAQE